MSLAATKTNNSRPQRPADFDTLIDALDYAALGETGCNFYDAKGRLCAALGYAELRHRAQSAARRLLGLGLQRGERVALIADTDAAFIVLFFACRYAGLVPFAMPVPVHIGSHDIYVAQLRGLLQTGAASVAISPPAFFSYLHEATKALRDVSWVGTPQQLHALPESAAALQPGNSKEVAYLQFTSGSTRSPRGVVITEQAIMTNLRGIVGEGLKVRAGDRCASWLPFYHDMGLVGFVLGPVVSQLSVDYLRTRDFAVRPLQWLRLISRNRCTITFSPPSGFELCARRIRTADLADLDLGSWRVAGVGAEMIRPAALENFADRLAPVGFDAKAFLPCYGLAESSLAASFSRLGGGLDVMPVDALAMADRGLAVRVQTDHRKTNYIVNCGKGLPGHRVAVVDEAGKPLAEMRVGHVLLKGPSLMSAYFNDAQATAEVLTGDGWLDSGDLGYMFEGELYLTGRAKDIIIVNGRNIRAQDLEELAEGEAEIRVGDASAFGLDEPDGQPDAVLVVECRTQDMARREALIARLKRRVYEGFGLRCEVELVAAHTLPRTSSGKLSRVAAREGFIERRDWRRARSILSKSG